jgi:hypothetical protein
MCICTYRCIRHATSDVILKAGLALWVTVTTRPFRSLRICPNPVSERYGDGDLANSVRATTINCMRVSWRRLNR